MEHVKEPIKSVAPHHVAAPAPETKKPETFAGRIADIAKRLDAAVSASDAEAIAKCYEDTEALKPGKPGEELEHAALGRRLAHYAPRHTASIKAVADALDAGLKAKPEDVKVKAEHPAVTKAAADLAAIKAASQGHVLLAGDAEAIAELEAKIAEAPLVDVPA